MAGRLILMPTVGATPDYWALGEHDEELLPAVLRDLAPYAAPVERAVLIHERDGNVISAWDEAGALRLAHALPPAYAKLAAALQRRYSKR